MKFKCDQCGTRYTIADEKVRRKVLKIRCKVCEHIMVVRDPEVDRRVGSANTPQPALVAAATTARRPSPRVAAESTVLSPPAPPAASAELEWYAAPGGEQIGPMPIERLVDLVRSGEVARDDVVWNETMADWTPVAEVEALEVALRPAAPPRPPAPPPPPSAGPRRRRPRTYRRRTACPAAARRRARPAPRARAPRRDARAPRRDARAPAPRRPRPAPRRPRP
ncbi:MAG: zinc-ribbon domain-containing protein [Myxococcales bacterium]|nr:zinc-ribbon domain-containing protein [Myxococcales bacterium]